MKKAKILIVEDEGILAKGLEKKLKKLALQKNLWVNSGQGNPPRV